MKREKLIRARVKKGLSQQAAAELMGVSRNIWSLWEGGKVDPYPLNVAELCTFFGVKEPRELDLEPSQVRQEHTTSHMFDVLSSKKPEGHDMDEIRRQLLHHTFNTTSGLMAASSPLVERFARVLAKPSLLDASYLSLLEKRTALLWQYRDDAILLPAELYVSVYRHAEHVTHLLEGYCLPHIYRQVLATGCKLFLLCGALLYDLGAYELARNHYVLASQAAAQAEDPLLQALTSTWMSFTWTYEHRYEEAADQIKHALSFLSDPNRDRSSLAWVSVVAAEIFAHLGTYDVCRSLLDQAETSLSGPADEQPHFYIHRFGNAQWNGFRGVCYQLLYDPKQTETVKLLELARGALENALRDPTVSFRQKQFHRADLASTYARLGEVDMACDLTIQTVQGVDQTTEKHLFKRLHDIQHLLYPYKDTPSVRNLTEAFSTIHML